MLKITLTVAFLACTLSASAQADYADYLDHRQRVMADRAVEYLDSLKSLTARFSETGPVGEAAAGDLTLLRQFAWGDPGDKAGMRRDYDDGRRAHDDGWWHVEVDEELKRPTWSRIGMGPGRVLVRAYSGLGSNTDILDVRLDEDVLEITYGGVHTADRTVLVFQRMPMKLVGWRAITDSGATTVTLTRIDELVRVDEKFVEMPDR